MGLLATQEPYHGTSNLTHFTSDNLESAQVWDFLGNAKNAKMTQKPQKSPINSESRKTSMKFLRFLRDFCVFRVT
jgi:hypothetical protein